MQGHGAHHQLWLTLHAAGNPDALSAVFDAVAAARFAVRPSDVLLERIRARLLAD